MLTGPAAACRKALKRARMQPGDIDLWEINEAFAAVVLRFMRALDAAARQGQRQRRRHRARPSARRHRRDDPRHVLDELERRDLATALVTLCVGAGMGTATIIERV